MERIPRESRDRQDIGVTITDMTTICNECAFRNETNLNKCPDCGGDTWLEIDKDGMVVIPLDLTKDDVKMLKAGARARYGMKRINQHKLEEYVAEILTERITE